MFKISIVKLDVRVLGSASETRMDIVYIPMSKIEVEST